MTGYKLHWAIQTFHWKPKWWQPWANTLLYMPLNSTDTYTDKSWNNIGTTNYSVTFWTNYWVDCGYFNGSSAHIQINPFSIPAASTILVWFYRAWLNESDGKIFDARSPRHIIAVNSSSWEYTFWYLGSTAILSWKLIQNQRCLCCLKTNWSNGKLIILWNNVNTTVSISVSVSTGTPSYINIWNEYNNAANRHFLWWLSNIIVENRERTDQEVTDYYNLTKANYWL